jgi:zinc protease
MPVTLQEPKRFYHEDNFATQPELTIAWPSAEEYSKDAYALNFLARILAEGKKAPLYKVLVKEKQITSTVNAYNYTMERPAGSPSACAPMRDTHLPNWKKE